MDIACITHGKDEKSIKYFGGKARGWVPGFLRDYTLEGSWRECSY
jgi:hypothetical protein